MELPSLLRAKGDQFLFFDSLDSTMDEARRQSVNQLTGRLWIVAGMQTAGRGRQGKTWSSPSGNLSMTLLLPAPCALAHQPKLGFVAGIALANATRGLLGEAAHVALKWPNDLLVNGAKASGLLLEGLGNGAAVALGIGVNVASHPEDTPYPATHLAASRASVTVEQVFSALACGIVDQLEVFGDVSGFSLIRSRWLAFSAHLGQRIVVKTAQGECDGVFKDIDPDGRLLLEAEDGLLRIDAGDVFPLDKRAASAHDLNNGSRKTQS